MPEETLMSNTRHQRRYGRRAPKNAPALMLARFLTGKVPAHPVAADQLARLGGGWRMGGNDVAGCCVPVTWANIRRLITAVLGTEYYPTQDEIWTVYRTQNPDFDPNGTAQTNGPGSDADGGMDIQTLLEYLVKVGGPDGVKALGFAKVDVKNLDELKAAVAIFGCVWLGVNVLEANQQEFSDGQPWNYVKGSPLDGGHSIIGGGYGAGAGQLAGDIRIITWAEETSLTDSFMAHEAEEAWVVVWPEHLGLKEFLDGMNLALMAEAYTEITNGKPFPAVVPPAPSPSPQPTPQPTPTPAPAPTPGPLAQFVAELMALLKKWGF